MTQQFVSMTTGNVGESSLERADPAWRDRWSGDAEGVVVLDLGSQPAADHFPLPTDPIPDPEHPLRMVQSLTTGLAQLESDPTSPEEPRGVEPAALIAQAADAVSRAAAAGLLKRGSKVFEYPSPHGGSWVEPLTARGLVEVYDGRVDVITDIFGMMHEADQRAALLERANRLKSDGVLLMQYHTIAAIVRSGTWNALRHGHFAYYSTPVLVEMGQQVGLVAVGCWEFELYGGTIMLAFSKEGVQAPEVTAMIEREIAEGILNPSKLASLGGAVRESTAAIREFIDRAIGNNKVVAGYGAASRTSSLLRCANITNDEVIAIADASSSKHGRCMPGNRIPIISPAELVASRPDLVLLFVPDLLNEVRAALPEIEAAGGRWVVLDPMPREVDPVARER